MTSWVGPLINAVSTGYSIYNSERARDDAKNNPGTQTQNTITNALLDPDSPAYRALVEEERERQQRGLIDVIQRAQIQRRRAAAAGARFTRSEREDESRHKALMDAFGRADLQASNVVAARLGAAARSNSGAASAYNDQRATMSRQRAQTVAMMTDLARTMANTYGTRVQPQENVRSDEVQFGNTSYSPGYQGNANVWDTDDWMSG